MSAQVDENEQLNALSVAHKQLVDLIKSNSNLADLGRAWRCTPNRAGDKVFDIILALGLPIHDTPEEDLAELKKFLFGPVH